MKNVIRTMAGTVLLAGCYTYVPAEVDQVPLQTEVQAILSTAGEISLRERVGLQSGRLQGELVQRSAEQLMIAVPTTGPFTGTTGERLVQRIDIPRADVLMVEIREPSTPKTVGLLAGSVGVATAAAILVFNAERNPGSEGVEGPSPDDRIGIKLPFLLKP